MAYRTRTLCKRTHALARPLLFPSPSTSLSSSLTTGARLSGSAATTRQSASPGSMPGSTAFANDPWAGQDAAQNRYNQSLSEFEVHMEHTLQQTTSLLSHTPAALNAFLRNLPETWT